MYFAGDSVLFSGERVDQSLAERAAVGYIQREHQLRLTTAKIDGSHPHFHLEVSAVSGRVPSLERRGVHSS